MCYFMKNSPTFKDIDCSKVFIAPHYPYRMMDIASLEPSHGLYLVLRCQFKIVLLTLKTLHAKGISHSALSCDSLALDYGLIPYIVGLEGSACIDYEKRFSKRDLTPLLQDRRYISKYRLQRINSGKVVVDGCDETLRMDLYAFGVLLIEAFFHPVALD